MKKILNRASAPTPKFFKVLRNVGLALAAVGGTILAAPALPAIVITIGGYVVVAGAVLTSASQLTTMDDSE